MKYIHTDNQIAAYDDNHRLLAEVTFPDLDENSVNINHTFVDDSLRGQGIAGQLMRETASQLRKQGKKAVPTCSYAVKWFGKYRDEYSDILK
ncbi:GNAT family N-acetyltransferase [Clostridium sp. AM58-1XD]|uniref:GNAT family N-acetyltransferase n=1 Tax=Clostridium sp. AM58-1XD TaxID=2292307 RepID=UPI000E51C0CA|nr:GNAT family N-acetyltransferase [Clostridium sp. AM58-1XD]RGY96938.1 N-acetyltransferase [Clostridium sp. AM58-1XD]